MSNMILQSNVGSDYKPHPEGIHPAVCVDVIDLGLQQTEFQGQLRMTPKVKVVFESEQKLEDGRNCTISRNFTASLNTKAKLAEFLGKWRGRPVVPGETIDLGKLIGVSCTLVISHQQNVAGKIYAAIDAVSKPTKKLVPSGYYDPTAARKRIEEWLAGAQPQGASARPLGAPAPGVRGNAPVAAQSRTGVPAPGHFPAATASVPAPGQVAPTPRYAPAPQPAPVPFQAPAPQAGQDYDPEVGF
jgi:hypothetical protein